MCEGIKEQGGRKREGEEGEEGVNEGEGKIGYGEKKKHKRRREC